MNQPAPTNPSVLLALHDQELAAAIQDLLDSYQIGHAVSSTPFKIPEYCKTGNFSVALIDMDFPECRAKMLADLLQTTAEAAPTIKLILVGTMPPPGDLFAEETRVFNYLLKPFDPAWLVHSIIQAGQSARAEAEIAGLNERILDSITSASDLEKRLADLQRKSYFAELAGSLTHELKNLLSVIKVSSHFLIKKGKETALDARLMKHLDIIRRQTDHCHEQILRFSSFARSEGISRQVCNVNDVIRDLLTLLEYSLGSQDIALRVELQADLPHVVLEEAALRHIVMNLILNARDAMSGGGSLTIRTALRSGAAKSGGIAAVEVAVEDSGPGIPVANLEKIFEPFFTTKSGSQSSGLGLSISRRLAESFGGTLGAVPGPNPGARFLLCIPVNWEDAPGLGRERTPKKADKEFVNAVAGD